MNGRPPTLWTQLPEAAVLLADCAARAPAKIVLAYRFGDTSAVFSRADRRVAALRRLYRRAEPPIDTPAWRAWLRLDEQAAIEAAIAVAGRRRQAA